MYINSFTFHVHELQDFLSNELNGKINSTIRLHSCLYVCNAQLRTYTPAIEGIGR